MVMVYYCCCTVDVMIHSSGSSGLLTFSYSSLLNGKGKYLAVSFLSSFSYSIMVVLYYSILPTESPITLVLHSQTLATRVWLHKTSYCTIQTVICHHISQHTVSHLSWDIVSITIICASIDVTGYTQNLWSSLIIRQESKTFRVGSSIATSIYNHPAILFAHTYKLR